MAAMMEMRRGGGGGESCGTARLQQAPRGAAIGWGRRWSSDVVFSPSTAMSLVVAAGSDQAWGGGGGDGAWQRKSGRWVDDLPSGSTEWGLQPPSSLKAAPSTAKWLCVASSFCSSTPSPRVVAFKLHQWLGREEKQHWPGGRGKESGIDWWR
uniref:Uncharacterized protein n=1 Tax=Oryza sativa subsp. japonica TaxID=39947 RepID=Q6K1W9_ORYSJ|nr:hypothetical protein [Oryza sativa Japonica Group]BAD23749.1 hypothetical protein [Oryza sativa Japonica Group]